MNVISRVRTMLVEPAAAWPRIEQESGDLAYLLSRYVAFLAAVPAVFGFAGACIVGAVVPGKGLVRIPVVEGLLGAVVGYVMTCAAVVLLGFLIDAVVPLFGGRRDFASALKLAVYSYTPVWLAGVFLLLPGLRFLGLAAVYGAYILWTGLPPLMKTREEGAPTYAAVIAVCAAALLFGAAAVQRALFGLTTAF